MVAHPSLDHANMMSLCFHKEIGSQEPLLQHLDISDEVDLPNDYQDEIAMMIEYPEWLTNVILLPKKDNKVRVCVNFRDLNKDNAKNDFPLSHIHMLVNNTGDVIWVEERRGYISENGNHFFHDMSTRMFRSVFAGHLASLLVSDSGVIDDDFLDEGIVIVTRLPGWGLIDDVEIHDDFPWYYYIYQFLIFDTYPKVATTKDKRALRQ
ncbi:hypothetical protein AAG906_014885 [Vitis piasezkii]